MLNEEYFCEKSRDCITCEKNFNTKILIRPIKRNVFFESIIQNFKCEQYEITKKDFTLKKIQKEIEFEYSFVKYNDEKKQFILKSLANNFQICALVSITDKLSKNNIDYFVCENSEIVQLKL